MNYFSECFWMARFCFVQSWTWNVSPHELDIREYPCEHGVTERGAARGDHILPAHISDPGLGSKSESTDEV